MLTRRHTKTLIKQSISAALLCLAALSLQGVTPLAATEELKPIPARLAAIPPIDTAIEQEARLAAAQFVWGLSNGYAKVVWQFATEEEQDALATEDELYNVFAQAYPPIAYAKQMTFEAVSPDGELQMVSLYVKDRLNLQWRASFGLWKDDAGDWKVVTLSIEPAPGEFA